MKWTEQRRSIARWLRAADRHTRRVYMGLRRHRLTPMQSRYAVRQPERMPCIR